jgi:4,5-dihydroxyphthalate decarboxylase
MTEKLSIVLGPHGQVQDLRSGAVRVDGYDLDFIDIKRMPDAYRAMARTQPYDICEMAPTSYLMALAAGAPITALPLPMTRRFRHAGVQVRRSAGVAGPKDLEGRKLGVRAYSVTAAVWTRGVFAEEYGLDIDKVRWLTEEDENVQAFPPPPTVQRVKAGESLAAMLEDGRLDGAFAGLAGAGAAAEALGDELVELVPDAAEREADWFRRTGIYPLHGVIVVRNEILERHPDLAMKLFDAFSQAKQHYLRRIEEGVDAGAEDKRYARLAKLVGDPLPYGLQENGASFEALVRYAHRQHLIPTAPALEQAFYDPRSARIQTNEAAA